MWRETPVTDLVVMGEISTKAQVDYEGVVRRAIPEVGYSSEEWGINADTVKSEV